MDIVIIKLNPEAREIITVDELGKHIFGVIKKAKSEPRWYRNYPTILSNLLFDLCRDSEGHFSQDQVDRFSPKFDEAITLLKELRLLVDVTTARVPTVRLSSLGEESEGQEIYLQQDKKREYGRDRSPESMPYVFISHVHENQEDINRLCNDLNKNGIKVWLNRSNIKPGARWRDAIEEAIQNGAYFIACFSKEYNDREENYMNEELTLAVDRLRRFSTDHTWFIPVKLNKCAIPNRRISAVDTLQDLHYTELHNDWDDGVQHILDVIQSSRMDAKEEEIRNALRKINPQIIKELDEGKKRISVVANSEDFAKLVGLNDDCGVLRIEPSSNIIFGYQALKNIGIYTVRDNHGAKVHFHLSFSKEPRGTQKQQESKEQKPQISEDGAIDADMAIVESYESENGGVFRILAAKKLKLASGDYDSLLFRVVPPSGESWNCIIKVNNVLYALLCIRNKNIGSLYDAHRKLGTLRIREAIDEGKSFSEHKYTTYDMDTIEAKLQLFPL